MTQQAVPSLTKRQQLGERSRREILDAASELLARQGYAGTSISQLSKACGLPVSSIYWHFNSKEGVLAAVVEENVVQFLDGLPGVEHFEGTPLKRLQRMLDALSDS